MKKEIFIGFLIGVAANVIGIYFYILIFIDLKFDTAIEAAIENGSIGSIIGLGAILNLVAFFLLLRKNQLYRARGVMLATLIAAIVILVSKFF